MDRIDQPTSEQFCRDYLARGRPVVITGMASQWAAASWTPEYFKRSFAGVETTCEVWDGDESVNDPLDFIAKQTRLSETVQSFVEKMEASTSDSRRFYCAEWRVFEAIPQLRSAIGALDPYMGFSAAMPSAVTERLRLEPLLWMGPAGVISTLHFDRAHNFFLQIYGRKKWIMVDPAHSRDVYYPCADFPLARLHMSPVDVEHPDFERFPRYRSANPIELVIEPGEILFIPAGWWHYVRALEPSLSMNFFWLKPSILFTLRKHVYHSLRRRVLQGLGL